MEIGKVKVIKDGDPLEYKLNLINSIVKFALINTDDFQSCLELLINSTINFVIMNFDKDGSQDDALDLIESLSSQFSEGLLAAYTLHRKVDEKGNQI